MTKAARWRGVVISLTALASACASPALTPETAKEINPGLWQIHDYAQSPRVERLWRLPIRGLHGPQNGQTLYLRNGRI
jgi:hypothetical protein